MTRKNKRQSQNIYREPSSSSALDLTASPLSGQAGLLPNDQAQTRPLLTILTIMAFLSAIALILTAMSFRSVDQWKSRITQSATVQITQFPPTQRKELAQRTQTLLNDYPPIKSATLISRAQSKALLRPWLGNVSLPVDLPLPILFTLEINAGANLEIEQLKQRLASEDISAQISDNRRYSRQVRKTGRTIQATMILILCLILLSAIATSLYATQAALTTHRKIITVLMQVGGTHFYVMRLIAVRFFKTGFVAGVFGGGLAVIFIFIFSILSYSAESASIFGKFDITVTDMLRFGILPPVFALFCTLTAAMTCHTLLKSQSTYV